MGNAGLNHLSARILSKLRNRLAEKLGRSAFSADVELPEDSVARLLYQLAFDARSARHAIEMRGLTTLLGPEHDNFGPWLERAAAAWGLRTDRSYWLDRVRDVIASIHADHAVQQLRPRMNVAEIQEMVVQKLFEWRVNALRTTLPEGNKLPITNAPEGPQRI